MCPACITGAALAIAGVSSAGGLTALVWKRLQRRHRAEENDMNHNPIVSRDAWLAARKEHLRKEKELTHLRDQVNAQRRTLPWVRVDKEYVFEGPDGHATLADLFDGRSQLIVQHFMFGPDWKEGCVGCSFQADHVDAALVHVVHRDVTFVAVSRAPLHQIEAFKRRMGWHFKWVSSYGNDFNYDYGVSFTKDQLAAGKACYNYELQDVHGEEAPGMSVFYKDERGDVFHTYSSYARGDELLVGTYNYLDLVPKGRDEQGPNFNLTDWVKHHDRYGEDAR